MGNNIFNSDGDFENIKPNQKRKTLLWLDDVRDPFTRELYDDPIVPKEIDWLDYSPIGKDVDVTWVKTYQEFVDHIMIYELPDAICFDHDLGTHNGTGMDCANWLVNYCLNTGKKLPKWAIQSANPVGKENIKKLLENYEKEEKKR